MNQYPQIDPAEVWQFASDLDSSSAGPENVGHVIRTGLLLHSASQPNCLPFMRNIVEQIPPLMRRELAFGLIHLLYHTDAMVNPDIFGERMKLMHGWGDVS